MEVAKATESKFKIMREISKEQAFLLACKFEADALLAYTEREWLMYGSLSNRLIAKLDKVRRDAEKLRGHLLAQPVENRSVILVQHFVMEQFTAFKRFALKNEFNFQTPLLHTTIHFYAAAGEHARPFQSRWQS